MGLNDNITHARVADIAFGWTLEQGWDMIVGSDGHAQEDAFGQVWSLMPKGLEAALATTEYLREKNNTRWTLDRCQRLFSQQVGRGDAVVSSAAPGKPPAINTNEPDTVAARQAEIEADVLPHGVKQNTRGNFRFVGSHLSDSRENKRKRTTSQLALVNKLSAEAIGRALKQNAQSDETQVPDISLFVWLLGLEASGIGIGTLLRDLRRELSVQQFRVLLVQELCTFDESGAGPTMWKGPANPWGELNAAIREVRAVLEVRPRGLVSQQGKKSLE